MITSKTEHVHAHSCLSESLMLLVAVMLMVGTVRYAEHKAMNYIQTLKGS